MKAISRLQTNVGVRVVASGARSEVNPDRLTGATRDEVISAILVGLPAAGNAVTQVLPAALRAYDEA